MFCENVFVCEDFLSTIKKTSLLKINWHLAALKQNLGTPHSIFEISKICSYHCI